MIHHRKTSIWSDSIDNVHPFPINNGRFFILQNGSSQIIHDWGVINFLDEVKTHSDTYYLSKFIEEKWGDSLESITWILSKLIRTWTSLWVICVVDTSNSTILVLSDGCRSLYIDRDIAESKVYSFSSLTEIGEDDRFFKWYIVLDFYGNILDIKYEYINKVHSKALIPLATNKYSAWDSEDEYYYSEGKKKDQLLLSDLWKDSEDINWIDPALLIDSKELNSYLAEFWDTEKELADKKANWMGQWWVWESMIDSLCYTANLVYMEMNDLVEDFFQSYPNSDAEYLYDYIEHEGMGLMEICLEYSPNFEYDI